MSQVKILVVDDHPVVRDGLVAMLATQADFDVVGTAADGEEALAKIRSLEPEVVLLDLEMPRLDGVGVLERLQAEAHPVQTIVFTVFDTDERILAAVRAGARGYLLKGAPRDELFRAVRVVCQGGSLLEPLVASKLMGQVSHGPDGVTQREEEVLKLLARGQPNRAIAEQLFISERTVKFHVSALLRKLNAANRTEAVARAVEKGLIER